MKLDKTSLGAIGIGIGSLALGGALGYAAGKSASKRKKSRSTKNRKSKSYSNARRRKGGRRSPRTAGKGRDRSRKRIRYTKNGQPYVIMASGKARFIKKRGARASHKKQGGRY